MPKFTKKNKYDQEVYRPCWVGSTNKSWVQKFQLKFQSFCHPVFHEAPYTSSPCDLPEPAWGHSGVQWGKNLPSKQTSGLRMRCALLASGIKKKQPLNRDGTIKVNTVVANRWPLIKSWINSFASLDFPYVFSSCNSVTWGNNGKQLRVHNRRTCTQYEKLVCM